MVKKIIALSLIGLLSSTYAVEKTQCGMTDERVLSYDLPIGRMLKKKNSSGGCTGTLISKSCIVSAGHCNEHANVIEFNTEASVGGKIVHPGLESIYFKSSIIDYQNVGAGYDWMVFRVHPNQITGEYAGDVQGTYEFSFQKPVAPLDLVITGYGRDKESDRNLAQQVGHGELIATSRTRIEHNVDTQGGNSGAVIVAKESNKIIGIHTHGGCSAYGGNNTSNKGTMLAGQKKFQEAIKNCLLMDEYY